jgi:hypothetical protein
MRPPGGTTTSGTSAAGFTAEGYAALGVDLFDGRNRPWRMFAGGMAGNLDHYGVPPLKAVLGELASHPEADAGRIVASGGTGRWPNHGTLPGPLPLRA